MKYIVKILLLVITLNKPLYAWENTLTHPAITEQATDISVINDFLRTQLGLKDGVYTPFYWDFHKR